MNTNTFRFSIAAAAVVVVALLGYQLLPKEHFGGPLQPTASPGPTSISTPTPAATIPTIPRGSLAPGTYSIALANTSARVVLDLQEGWDGFADSIILLHGSADPPDGAGLAVWQVSDVYADPCGHLLVSPRVGAAVDDLAAALGSIPGTDATSPTAVEISGYRGQYLELTLRADIGCSPGTFYLWGDLHRGIRYAQGIGELDRLWILDVAGTRILILAESHTETSDADIAQLQEVVDSIRFEVP